MPHSGGRSALRQALAPAGWQSRENPEAPKARNAGIDLKKKQRPLDKEYKHIYSYMHTYVFFKL